VTLIVVNAQGWEESTARRADGEGTPRLDTLAREGMTFRHYLAGPVAETALAEFLSGRFAYLSGVSGNTHGEHVLPSPVLTLGEVFRENGYRTAFLGAWKNGENWPHVPEAQGFETTGPATVDGASAFLGDSTKQPGLLVLSLEDGAAAEHFLAADPWTRTDREHLLVYVGAAVSDRVEGEWEENTVRLQGSVGSVHEGGMRTPCVVRWPGRVTPGSTFDRIAAPYDWLPTLVDWLGLALPGEYETEFSGISLAPALDGGGRPARWPNRILCAAWTPPGFDTGNASVAVRTDRWLAVRDRRWSLDPVSAETFAGWELYDRQSDPWQRHNLAEEYPYLLSDMRADFAYWMDRATRFGLRPVPTELGHPEWPVVRLASGRRTVTGEWPLRVIRAGSWMVEGEGAAFPLSLTVGQEGITWESGSAEPLKLEKGDLSLRLDTDTEFDGAIILRWDVD